MKRLIDQAPSGESPLSIGKAVELLQSDFPDMSPSTLRFLEGEGLLAPARTPGGHRLYRPEDIERIRFIRTMQRRHFPLAEIRQRLSQIEKLGDPARLGDAFFERATAGDLAGAARIVRDADHLGLPLATTFVDVIGGAMRRVGDEWERGTLLVGQEKEATELAKDLVAELSARHAGPITRTQVVLAAAVEGEHHDLGLRMVAGLLREQGYPVHLLGADVAIDFLIESLRLREPDLLLLGAAMPERFPAIADTVRRMRAEVPEAVRPQVVVGGPVVARHHEALKRIGVVPAPSPGVRAATRAVLDRIGVPSPNGAGGGTS